MSARRVAASAATPRSLLEQASRHQERLVDAYVERLLEAQPGAREHIRAIVLYGSCLSVETRKTGAFFDFFVVVDSYRGFFSRTAPAVIGAILPPSVYYAGFASSRAYSAPLPCKYNVVSQEDLARETGPHAHDVHLLGRFSKRVAIVHASDEASRQQVLECMESAMRTLLDHTLTRLQEPFTLEELLMAQLGISYEGEHRVREAAKVRALLDAERPFYEQIYGRLLEERIASGQLARQAGGGETRLAQVAAAAVRQKARRATDGFLERSRLRGVCRWPKYVFTVDNWVDIVLDKLERHNGVKIELTPLERRYPLVFGWAWLIKLVREGLIR